MLDIAEEKKHRRLRQLGQKLHIPIPETFWTLEVMDRNGNLLREQRQRGHSYLRNAYNNLLTHCAALRGSDAVWGAGNLNVRNHDGTVYSSFQYPCMLTPINYSLESAGSAWRGAMAQDNEGILVGSSNAAWDFDQYALAAQIHEGNGAGQLNHAEGDAPVRSYDAGTRVYTVEWVRLFNNNSGGDVSINEVCISGASWDRLVTRDVLGATVTVPDSGQLRVTYTIQLTYPA